MAPAASAIAVSTDVRPGVRRDRARQGATRDLERIAAFWIQRRQVCEVCAGRFDQAGHETGDHADADAEEGAGGDEGRGGR